MLSNQSETSLGDDNYIPLWLPVAALYPGTAYSIQSTLDISTSEIDKVEAKQNLPWSLTNCTPLFVIACFLKSDLWYHSELINYNIICSLQKIL